MNIGPLNGINTGAAGSPLVHAKGAEVERAGQQLGAERRRVYHGRKAAAAAGVGEPDGEDHEASTERDADGRRPWEEPPEPASARCAAGRRAKTPRGRAAIYWI